MKRIPRHLCRWYGLALGFALGLAVFSRWPRPSSPAAAPIAAPPAEAVSGEVEIPDLATILRDRQGLPADWDPGLGAPPQFTDVSEAAGVTFAYYNGNTGRYHYPEIMGGGVALFDYDGDEFLDIYFANGNRIEGAPSTEYRNCLYRNNGDGTFTDVTVQAAVGDTGYGHGCCVGDYDGDGDPDLYVSNLGANVLYRNNGDGTFTDVSREAGVADPLWSQSSSFLDFDGDGLLDLYVQNYLTYSVAAPVDAFIYVGGEKLRDYPSPISFPGAPDRLYRNQGDGTFADVTAQAGMLRPDGKGMGVACWDMDHDGLTDIFVANDGMENFLFRNRGGGAFEEIGLAAGVAFDDMGVPESSMGVDIADYDGDGWLDMIVPCTRKQVYTLYRNLGTHFADVSAACGLAQLTSDRTGFCPLFLDYDNDGDPDLFFSTGGVRANQLIAAGADYQERYGVADLLLASDGKGRFRDVSSLAGPHFQRELIGRGAAKGDLDNDGDLDIVISNLAGPATVLRNETRGGHWIVLRLIAARGNREALGARVRVEAAGRAQSSAVHGGVTFLSQSDRRVHFGLGSATVVERIEIIWPDGERQVLEDLAADQHLTIVQAGQGPPMSGRVLPQAAAEMNRLETPRARQ